MENKPKKSLGQNFLIDKNIIKNIISIINPSKNDFIIEIGPGKGALTIPLSQKVENISAIEIDPLLTNYLINKNISNLTLFNKDQASGRYVKGKEAVKAVVEVLKIK